MMKTILIVDDRVINLEFLAMLLEFAGYRIIKAANGAEGLDLARIALPDLVITDIVMPVMDGIELVNRLHADAATVHIPVIFYTATYNVKEVRLLATTLTAAAVLIKPADPQNILDLVGKTLGRPSVSHDANAPSAALPPVSAGVPHQLQQTSATASDAAPELSAYSSYASGSMSTLGLRLAAFLELGVTLSTQRTSQDLLTQFCRGAKNIMNVSHVAVGMSDDGSQRFRASSGLPAREVDEIFDILDANGGFLRQHLASGATLDMHTMQAQAVLQKMGPLHALRRKYLMVPIRPRSGLQGWFYMAGRRGTDDFNVADSEFAATLTVQLASLYDNLRLFEEAQEHVSRLEEETHQRKLVVERLQQSEAGLRRAQILTKSGHIILGKNSVFESWSKTMPHLIGVTEADMPKTLEEWNCIIGLADQAGFMLCVDAAGQFGRRMEVSYPLRRRSDGETIELHHVIEPLLNPNDAAAEKRWFHTIQDITEQKAQQRKVAHLSQFFAVLSGINSAIVRIHDRNALFQEACRIAVSLGGFSAAVIGTIDLETLNEQVLVCASRKPSDTEKIRHAAYSGRSAHHAPWSLAVRELRPVTCNNIGMNAMLPHKDGLLESGCQSLAVFPLILDDRAVAVMTLFSHEIGTFDVEELKLLEELAGDLSFGLRFIDKEEKLNYLANYDALTGLPNKMLFQDRLTQFLQGAPQHSDVVCVVLLDLDHFSQLNDVRGRHTGDAVLIQVANRLRATLDESFSLARIGADVFAIAMSGTPQEVTTVIEQQLFAALDTPFTVDRKEITITTRAGFALSPDDGRDTETLFKHAEIALKNAKSSSQHYVYYSPQMNAAVAAKAALKAELQLALDTHQFVVHYQPRVDLVSGRIVSAEALIRWQHPERGMVPPDQFIPIAEVNGLILPIGAWIIDAVCAQQTAWLAQGVAIVPVAVNLSGVQLNQGRVLNTIEEALSRHNLEAKYIEFELTESVVMNDAEGATRNLQLLKDKGVKLALDDFGTGYSSLAYLKHFPFDILKIDRAFITDITKSPRDAMIPTAVIALGHSLNLRVVAEGVETEEQLEYLRDIGCDEIQGYYFSRPVPAIALENMLHADKCLVFANTLV
ncbi:MAG: EAL domain-containing protein [Herminiimonas sp.]|nr:EAL domain-containing protein [Herminiimonas sp.]